LKNFPRGNSVFRDDILEARLLQTVAHAPPVQFRIVYHQYFHGSNAPPPDSGHIRRHPQDIGGKRMVLYFRGSSRGCLESVALLSGIPLVARNAQDSTARERGNCQRREWSKGGLQACILPLLRYLSG